ncbi:hypothetical protein MRX96_059553 [Rhipicephalus microplus]
MIPQGRYACDVAHYHLLQPQQTSSLGHSDDMWQHRPAYAPVMQFRPVVPIPRTSARYPLRLASIPYHEIVLAPPLMSPDKPGTLVDPSAVYPCGSYEAYLEAKKRRV